MPKEIKYLLVGGVILGILVVLAFSVGRDSTDQPTSSLGSQYALAEVYLNDNRATTSPTFQGTGTASSTFIIRSANADIIDLNIQLESTSTSPTLVWTTEFSTGNPTCENFRSQADLLTCDADWFGEDGSTVDSSTSVTHGSPLVFHRWTHTTTTDAVLGRKNITIDPVASGFTRVTFSVSGADADLWVQAVLREPVN